MATLVSSVSSPPAIFVLSQFSVALGRRLAIALPGAKLYGLVDRTTAVDVSFTDFGDTVRQLFQQGTPIIGICAAGILVRTVAPLLQNKWQEPPLLAIAEDGSAVVPLLGGLQGANHLARAIGMSLGIDPAITTTGDIRFRTALLSPPAGYSLAHPAQGKQFLADLLAGATVKLEGQAAWLTDSQIPIAADGTLIIKITERVIDPQPNLLIYHPRTVAVAIATEEIHADPQAIDPAKLAEWINQWLEQHQLAVAAIAGIFAWAGANDVVVQEIANHLQVPFRSMALNEFETAIQMDATIAEIEVQGIEVQGIEVQGIEVQGIEVQGIEVQGIEVQGIEVQGIEAQGIEAQGIEAQGIEAQGIEAQGIARAIATVVTQVTQADQILEVAIPEELSQTPGSPYHLAIAIAAAPIDLSADLSAIDTTTPLVTSANTSANTGTIAGIITETNTGAITGANTGSVTIVGTGPGGSDWMSPEVKNALLRSQAWIGYKTYLDLVEPLRTDANQRYESDNRVELDRARHALNLALAGQSVAVISSGDPGIFAMAAAVFEVLDQAEHPDWNPEWRSLSIQVCPGISAMQAAAAQVGAPLGHDFCAISLSDILKPWDVIEQRIAAAAAADFAIAFYNPVSRQRLWQLERAKECLLQWRSPETPIVLARDVGRPQQGIKVRSLGQLTADEVDMRTIVLVGSSKTRRIERLDGGVWVYTPRQYD